MKSNKADLLLLHGALGVKSQFDELKKALTENFNVYTMNFSGHGREPLPGEPFSIEMFAEDILKFIDSLGIESINIFGYSMGGYAAMYLAKHNPEKINKIFTLATKFLWSPEIAEREAKMLDAEKIKQKVPKYAEELSLRHGAENWEKVLTKTSEMMVNLGKNNVLKVSDFREIAHEILVGIGDSDKMVTLDETVCVYRKLRKGSLLVLPSTPHPLEKVDVSRLTGEICRFFTR